MILYNGKPVTKFEILNMEEDTLREFFEGLEDNDRVELLSSLSDEEMLEVFRRLDTDQAAEALTDLDDEEISKLISDMPFSDSVALINELEEEERDELLKEHQDISKKLNNLKQDFLLLHPKDVANKIDEMTEDERSQFFNLFNAEELAEFFACLDEEDAAKYLQELSDNKASDVLENMYTSDAVDIINELDDDDKDTYLELMDDDTKDEMEELSEYADDEVGSIMDTDFIEISASMDVKEAMKVLVNEAPDVATINTLFVVDNDKFVGTLDFRRLIVTKSPCKIASIMDEKDKYCLDTDNTEYAIKLINDYDIYALPVLKDEKIVGIVTIDSSLETLSDEQEEDYNQLAGLTGEHEDDETIMMKVKRRIPWLSILICLDLIVCLLISAFEGVINELTVLVLFQPVILGLSGNVGTQSLAVCVRSLANNELNSPKNKIKHILSELRNGFSLGLIISVLTFGVCLAFLKISKSGVVDGVDESIKIAVIVATSILASLSLSSLFGCLMPIVFNSLHIDPAAASGPFITTLNDVLAITTYFTLASILLSL